MVELAMHDHSLRNRIGGRYSLTVKPWIWSIPLFVFLIPLANADTWTSEFALLSMIGYSAFAWIGFGAVLYLASRTVMRNRALTPASPLTVLFVGGLAGLTRSLMLGDWFTFMSLEGDHNLGKVVNAIFTGWAWIIVAALIVSGSHFFQDQYESLINQQTNLLISSEEWLTQVHKQRDRIVETLRPALDKSWSDVRAKIHSVSGSNNLEWQAIAREVALVSGDTVRSLASSLRTTRLTPAQTRSPLREAIRIISHEPVIDSFKPPLLLIALGTLPMVRYLGANDGIRITLNAAVLIFVIQEIAKRLILRFPKFGPLIYVGMTTGGSATSFFLIPLLQLRGISKEAAVSFAVLGMLISLLSIPIFSYLALTRNRQDDSLSSLHHQNALLASLNASISRQSFEAALDVSRYLETTVARAIASATKVINEGIASGDPQETQAGLALVEAIYSNVFGNYSEFEDLDLDTEISSLVERMRNQVLATYVVDAPDPSRELARRVLIFVNEVTNQAVNAKALRLHLDVRRDGQHIVIKSELNLPPTWLSQYPIAQDVFDAVTKRHWKIEGTQSGSTITGVIEELPKPA